MSIKRLQLAAAAMVAIGLSIQGAHAGYIDELQNTAGLISHWGMEETTGNTVADSVTTDSVDGDNPGTFNAGKGASLGASGPRPSDGFLGFSPSNNAISFAGGAGGANNTSPYVDPDHQGLLMDPTGYTGASGLNAATLIMWFQITDSTEQHYHLGGIQRDSSLGSGGRYGLAMNHYDDAGEGLRLFSRVGDPQASEQAMSTSNGASPDYYAPSSGAASWHMAVATIGNDGSDKVMKLYVDGVLLDTEMSAGNAGLNLSTRDSIIFGQDSDLDNGRQMVGQLDEIAFFDRALSGEEITHLYNAAVVPEPGTGVAMLLGLSLLALRRRV
ncbi:LamG-like jellyroll fold domain-containing protein [Aeoliella sp.]|uniref:LamG-like jellyroll fold domain-containing protein n=1 Tax=Aeoliella sp. TaxID=2795800 RepID=UPI003CCC387F